MNIFVGNLSFEAKEIDVQRAFAAFGVVTTVAIVMEKKGKKSRGFGFVEMPDEQEALAAIAQLQDKEILGRPINVMAALSKEPKSSLSSKRDKYSTVVASGQDSSFKRTGKYKEGRRSLSYAKQRLDSGIITPVPARRYKSNPMRWLKKPRSQAYSAKPEGELKPWQRPQTEANPWKKPQTKFNSWKKPEGELKPWQKSQGEAKPWRKTEGDAKPWKKAEGEAKPWKKTESPAKPWKKFGSEARPWEKSRGGSKPWIKTQSGEVKSWKKVEGEVKPRQKTTSAARPWKKTENSAAAARPWKKTARAAKPWRKSSADRQQSGKKPSRFSRT